VRNNEEEEELKIDSESLKSKNISHKNSRYGAGVKKPKDGNSTVMSKKDDPDHI
jgi:hypothetical protein